MVSPVNVPTALKESYVRTIPMTVPASLVRMEPHAQMESTATHVNVLLAMRELGASRRHLNVTVIPVRMVANAVMVSMGITVHVYQDSQVSACNLFFPSRLSTMGVGQRSNLGDGWGPLITDGHDFLPQTGQNCETDIDECASNPCIAEATCDDGINGYLCLCADGRDDEDCDVPVDECSSDPCQNGATCQDRIEEYVCACANGFEGELCAEEVDECESNPCQNGGNCTDKEGGYTCSCAPGYTGQCTLSCCPVPPL